MVTPGSGARSLGSEELDWRPRPNSSVGAKKDPGLCRPGRRSGHDGQDRLAALCGCPVELTQRLEARPQLGELGLRVDVLRHRAFLLRAIAAMNLTAAQPLVARLDEVFAERVEGAGELGDPVRLEQLGAAIRERGAVRASSAGEHRVSQERVALVREEDVQRVPRLAQMEQAGHRLGPAHVEDLVQKVRVLVEQRAALLRDRDQDAVHTHG